MVIGWCTLIEPMLYNLHLTFFPVTLWLIYLTWVGSITISNCASRSIGEALLFRSKYSLIFVELWNIVLNRNPFTAKTEQSYHSCSKTTVVVSTTLQIRQVGNSSLITLRNQGVYKTPWHNKYIVILESCLHTCCITWRRTTRVMLASCHLR